MSRIFQAGLVLVVGAILLPVVKVILDQLNETMVVPLNDTIGLSTFELAVMDFYPLSILVALFVAAALSLRPRRHQDEFPK